jgi:hypothetical protein
MKKYCWFSALVVVLLGISVAAGAQWYRERRVPNPDPDHTHADFAVWVDSEKMIFSASEFMSGLSTDASTHDEAHEVLHPNLHLHDGNGNIVHRHKPGLTLEDFFTSLHIAFDPTCYVSTMPLADGQICSEHPWRMFVNGTEQPFDLTYVFEDMDRILLTTAPEDTAVQAQLADLTDDACLYSRTCPGRGEPPVENCIADPSVPCVAPLE